MIVVSDTSPLRYLILIEAVDVLFELFGEVLIPPAVVTELVHTNAPLAVRDWMAAPPGWLKIQAPSSLRPIGRLDPGEVEAISLALEIDADQLIIDDRSGKQTAQSFGLSAVGTLAILDLAGRRGLLDFRKAITTLEADTNFRMSRRLRDQLLLDHPAGEAGGESTSDVDPA